MKTDFDNTVNNIRRLYQVLHPNKSHDVNIYYSSNDLGNPTPWKFIIGTEEILASSSDDGAKALQNLILNKIKDKLSQLKGEAKILEEKLVQVSL